jgi:hypothetical protein
MDCTNGEASRIATETLRIGYLEAFFLLRDTPDFNELYF